MKNISVIGIGRLGLSFALSLEKNGYNVMGVDLHQDYVDDINNLTFISPEPGISKLLKQAKNFTATTDLKRALEHSDVLFCVVATNTLVDGHYDHTVLDRLCDSIMEFGPSVSKKHIVVQSTTIPGYCDKLKDRLNGYNYIVSYNPEFIRQGAILEDQKNPDLVLIGAGDNEAEDILVDVYKTITENNPPIKVMDLVSAEITKLALNCFLTTKISFANMIGDIAIKAGADGDKILDAISSDVRIGYQLMKYGFGYGGTCLPRDNRALASYAHDIGMPANLSIATDNHNVLHLDFQINEFIKTHDEGESIIVDGITFKDGSDIIEESQKLAYAVGLARSGYNVTVIDEKEVLKEVKKIYGNLFKYEEKD